jgi:hypothetical protein
MDINTLNFIENEIAKMQWMDRRFFCYLEERELGLLDGIPKESFEQGLDDELKFDERVLNFKEYLEAA